MHRASDYRWVPMPTRLAVATCMALGCLLGTGCSPQMGRYLGGRGRDLADCFVVEAGLGWPLNLIAMAALNPDAEAPSGDNPNPIEAAADGLDARTEVGRVGRPPACLCCVAATPQVYARAKATDFVVVGGGWGTPVRWGWRGRYQRGGGVRGYVEAGLPVLWNFEDGCGPALDGGEHIDDCEVETVLLVSTTRTYRGVEPPPEGATAERFWVGVVVSAGLSARVEVNPVELADFLVGWSGWDMLADDGWSLREEVRKRERQEERSRLESVQEAPDKEP